MNSIVRHMEPMHTPDSIYQVAWLCNVYSPGGLLDAMIDSEGYQTDYLYDPLNRLVAVRNADNGNSLVEGYAYDRFDNRSSVTSSAGAVEAYVYDDAQQLKEIRQPGRVQ